MMDLGLSGEAVMVTGGSGGIGKAIAIAYGREQANVVVTYYRDEIGARQTVDEIKEAGGNGVAIQMSLKDNASIIHAMDATFEAFRGIAVLVNNALDWSKRQEPGGLEASSIENWTEMVKDNLFGTYMVTRAVTSYMKRRAWGRIVHISSDLAVDGMVGSSAYTSTKSALHGFSKTLSKELAVHGIFSNVVLPGMTMTERAKRTFPPQMIQELSKQNPTGRLGEPEDIANVVTFLGSQANRFVNGEIIRVTGGHSGGYYIP